MTAAVWLPYIGGASGAIAIATFLWRKVIRPVAAGCRRLMLLLDRLLELLDAWPEINAALLAQSGQLTELTLDVSAARATQSQLKTDVDAAFERIRHLETHTGVIREPQEQEL